MPDPVTVEVDKTYILFYRHGNTMQTDWKAFSYKGSFRDAIERGKSHCAKTNLRFISVKPFITDFTEEERKHTAADQ